MKKNYISTHTWVKVDEESRLYGPYKCTKCGLDGMMAVKNPNQAFGPVNAELVVFWGNEKMTCEERQVEQVMKS
jgi:hypothetical protein